LTGVTGSAASVLNSIAHTIVNKTASGSPGPITWQLSTNTGGSPIVTASGGTAFAYAQSGATLTWTGQFDVLVRLMTDEWLSQIQAPRIYLPDQLVAMEERE
jgi:hypothetical protein